MKKLCFIFLFFISWGIHAQELNCQVTVNTQNIQVSDKKFYDNMQNSIYEFMNNRRWTNLSYKPQELLDCNVTLILSEVISRTEFKAQLSVQLRRPVFSSNYTTTLVNYQETEFLFTYDDAIPLQFEQNSFLSNLSSTLGFFAYVFLGTDADSFTLNGGAPYFVVAQNIVQIASSAGSYKGWKASDGNKSKYQISENYNNGTYQAIHTIIYNYHRQGLDLMTLNQTKARANIVDCLKQAQELHKQHTNLFVLQLFIDAKIDEIISIFTPAPKEEKDIVSAAIKEISPISMNKLTKAFNEN